MTTKEHGTLEHLETTAIIKVEPLKDLTISAMTMEVLKVLDFARERTILNIDDVKNGTDDLAIISKMTKRLKSFQSEYLAPIKLHLQKTKGDFDSILIPLKEADTITRQKILLWNAGQEEIRRKQEEAERLSREAAEAEMRTSGEMTKSIIEIENKAEPFKKVHTDSGSAATRGIKKWRLTDITKVPSEFLLVDAGKVTRLVKAGIGEIAGIEIYEEKTLVINTK